MRHVKETLSSPITKWILFRNAILPVARSGLCFGVGFVIILQIVTFFAEDPLSWQESILGGICAGTALCLFLVGMYSISIFQGMYRIIIQEKTLKFSFSDLMEKNNITSANYENHQWSGFCWMKPIP